MDTASPSMGLTSRAFGSLQRRLLLFVVLPLVLISALGIRFGLNQASEFQKERMKKDIELIARAIRVPVGTALAEGDDEGVREALQSVFTIGRVYGASVFDVDGVLLASAGVTEDDLTESSIPQELVASGEQKDAFREVGGREMLSHFLPVFGVGGKIEGLIQLNRRASDLDTVLDQLTVIAWLTWGGFTLAIILTVLLGHYGGVGRHVDKLLAHMKRIETGDLSLRATVSGPREVRAIAKGLNRMLDSIESKEAELHEHRKEEQKLLTQIKDNEKMAAIGRMARGIAHELGAPLSVIDGRARRLSLDKNQGDEARRQLDGIRKQVTRLTSTVNQLLNYSKPETSVYDAVTVNSLVNNVEDAIQPEILSGIKLEVANPVPSLYMEGDSRRLELALLNIVRNALQAARTKVAISVCQNGEFVEFQVDDDGSGLPSSEVDQLYEPFVTTKPPGKGTGLGLAIAKSAIDEHGGTLTMKNNENGGCRVSICLPRVKLEV